MKTTTQVQAATIITTHEGNELTEALLIGKGHKLDCYKRINGKYMVALKKASESSWKADKLIHIHELSPKEFFAYWDKKLNEWK